MAEIENIKLKINIKHIKSLYIIKTLFSFLNEKQKLNMIIYNKECQKICSVNIGDYEKISLKYKKGERNGEGREYIKDTKRSIFEGEYLNRKRNGKGKQYNFDGVLIFEGEYLNGKRNEKGKEYYCDDKLLFKGEYLNGKGKEYNFNGKLRFEGEYKRKKMERNRI